MKREHHAQFVGDLFSTLADTLKHHVQPFAVMVGLLAALERFIRYFIERAGEVNGPAGRESAINAVRAGLGSLHHTLDAIEKDTPQATMVVAPVKSPHLN